MELTQLKQFKTIAECENITRAAVELYISQPALSRAMLKFEKELGVELFDRTGNSVSLNSKGKLALKHVERILQEVENMKMTLRNFSDETSILRIGSSLPAFLRFVTPKFQSSHNFPRIIGQLVDEGSLVKLLLNKTLDIIISSDYMMHEDIFTAYFGEDRLMISVPLKHPLSDRSSIYLNELNGCKVLTSLDPGSFWNKRIKDLITAANIKLELISQPDYMVYRELVKKTDQMSFATALSLNYWYDIPNRKYIYVSDEYSRISMYVAYLKHPAGVVAQFIKWLKTDCDVCV